MEPPPEVTVLHVGFLSVLRFPSRAGFIIKVGESAQDFHFTPDQDNPVTEDLTIEKKKESQFMCALEPVKSFQFYK